MGCSSIQHIHAVKLLCFNNVTLLATVNLTLRIASDEQAFIGFRVLGFKVATISSTPMGGIASFRSCTHLATLNPEDRIGFWGSGDFGFWGFWD